MTKNENMIYIIDFGSQTTHLIGRRIRDFGVGYKLADPDNALEEIKKLKPSGIILSGGPASVYEKNSPKVDKKIFRLGIPVLAICYGQQLAGYLLGGKVKPGTVKEYGPAKIRINRKSELFANVIDDHFQVWMSHGDEVIEVPPGFETAAATENIRIAAMQQVKNKIYCVQFHPEVAHTKYGTVMLKNFVRICNLKISKIKADPDEITGDIKEIAGNRIAVAAVSGGVDSSVSAALVGRAIGKNLKPVFIDNGLMRPGTKERVIKVFENIIKIPVYVMDEKKLFLNKLKSVIDPEIKRKIIGSLYIECFEKFARNFKEAEFLVQGTIYSDVIESKGSKNASKIKSHHNVGGLPDQMKLKLIEPLREYYKDEVIKIGKKIGLPDEVINQQPFPGPGQAIRIIGEVTEERLERQQQADTIVLEEMEKSGWMKKVFQSFPVMTGSLSTAVKGDGRYYGEVVALRVYGSVDIMTASWSRLPYSLLQKISSRIVNEVPGVSRVVYDITTKPPATMEWE